MRRDLDKRRSGARSRAEEFGVLVVSNVRLYREGLVHSLENDGRLKVLGSAEGIAEVLDLKVGGGEKVVVLLDMAIPGALGAVRTLVESSPQVVVVALGISEKTRKIVECAEAGVLGYVCRDQSLDDLVRTARDAAAGRLECSSRVAGALVRRLGRLAALSGPYPEATHLTLREREIAELIDQGLSNKEIAKRLYIEVSTAKNHVHNILDKLGVHRRGEAAGRLRRAGILQPPRAAGQLLR